MDAAAFRWVLIIIAVVLALAIYFYGSHQSKLRKRSAIETFTREEIDSAFIEDEQLREELENLNQIIQENETIDDLDQIRINPAIELEATPYALPDIEVFTPKWLASKDEDRLISYLLHHEDFRLVTGEEASAAVKQIGLELNAEGLLEFRLDENAAFQVASLSAPGHFSDIGNLEFSTLGFNCFIDLDSCEQAAPAYEAMLKKIDELVRLMNLKVYKSNHELLTISDVTSARSKLD